MSHAIKLLLICGGVSVKVMAKRYRVVQSSIEAAIRFEMDAPAKRAWRRWYKGQLEGQR